MGLNIKNPEVEQLVASVAAAMGVSKTEAIRRTFMREAQIYGIGENKKKDHSELEAFLQEMWSRNPKIRETRFTKEDYDALFE